MEDASSSDYNHIFVMLCVRRDPRLVQCLQSLSDQSYPRKYFTVCVIENDDHPQYQALVEGFGFQHVTVAKPGIGEARAVVLNYFHGDVLANIDADCIASPDWLAETNASFQKNPKLGVLGGLVPKLAPATWVERWQRSLVPDDQRQLQYLWHISNLPYVAGANAAYRGEAVRQCGGFRHEYASGSDVDIAWRIQRLGYCAELNPRSLVYHACRTNIRAVFRLFVRYAIGHVLLFKEHSPSPWVICWYPKTGMIRTLFFKMPIALLLMLVRRDDRLFGKCLFEIVEYAAVQWGSILGAFKYKVVYL